MITVGSTVVCINDTFPPQVREWGREIPKYGRVYTVSATLVARHGVTGVPGPALVFAELHNPLPNGRVLCFSNWRFEELLLEDARWQYSEHPQTLTPEATVTSGRGPSLSPILHRLVTNHGVRQPAGINNCSHAGRS